MAGPKTTFDADECKTLLDWIESRWDGYQSSEDTPEEKAVLTKLREGAKET